MGAWWWKWDHNGLCISQTHPKYCCDTVKVVATLNDMNEWSLKWEPTVPQLASRLDNHSIQFVAVPKQIDAKDNCPNALNNGAFIKHQSHYGVNENGCPVLRIVLCLFLLFAFGFWLNVFFPIFRWNGTTFLFLGTGTTFSWLGLLRL